MRRREFITLLGGGAAAWPLTARAQQRERVRRIGLLINLAADDPESQARRAAFQQRLQQLGWTDGRNVRIIARWGAGDDNQLRRSAAELVAFAPDVILATSSPALAASQHATRTVPIVFTSVVDPVGGGFVDSLARPGGNSTGFTLFEYGLSEKWPELLKQIAPGVTRAAVLRDAATLRTAAGQSAAIQAAAPSLGVELSPAVVRDAHEIERAVTTFAGAALGSGVRAHSASEDARERAGDTRPEPGSSARVLSDGLIVTGSPLTAIHRDLIVALAALHRLPAVYPFRYFTTRGGLISYGPDSIEPYRRAAGYVDRILKGEKPANLPVQPPTKYDLVINLKTAKSIGLMVPPPLLARADEVIE
jgi:putative ABC transport system substrate-binding protein